MIVNTEDSSFVKDTNSGAFTNIDTNAYTKFLAARNQLKKQRNIENEFIELKREMMDIKNLLIQVITGKAN